MWYFTYFAICAIIPYAIISYVIITCPIFTCPIFTRHHLVQPLSLETKKGQQHLC